MSSVPDVAHDPCAIHCLWIIMHLLDSLTVQPNQNKQWSQPQNTLLRARFWPHSRAKLMCILFALSSLALVGCSDTSKQQTPQTPQATAASHSNTPPSLAAEVTQPPKSLIIAMGCVACHKIDEPLVGPAYQAIYKKYAHTPDAKSLLVQKIMDGGSGVWGPVAMPPHRANSRVSVEKVSAVVDWILSGAQ